MTKCHHKFPECGKNGLISGFRKSQILDPPPLAIRYMAKESLNIEHIHIFRDNCIASVVLFLIFDCVCYAYLFGGHRLLNLSLGFM